jgi:hypothetical protein
MEDSTMSSKGGSCFPHGERLYALVGIPHKGTTIPRDADGEWQAVEFEGQDYTFRLYKSGQAPDGLHRLTVVCPDCRVEMDAGHLGQHRGSKKCKPVFNGRFWA